MAGSVTSEVGGQPLPVPAGYVVRPFRREDWDACIELMLATPDVSGPIRLIKPEAFYLFADEDLESLSAGQKVLLRMGPENAARIKAKLAEIRAAL